VEGGAVGAEERAVVLFVVTRRSRPAEPIVLAAIISFLSLTISSSYILAFGKLRSGSRRR